MIRIVVDSTADLPPETFRRHNIAIVPLNLHFGTETYKEGVDIDHAGFYHKVESTQMIPKTSQPSPGEFIEEFRRVASQSDPVIAILISSKLSGTYRSAELAAQQLQGEMEVRAFDSLCGSAGAGFMAVEAARMAEAGQSADAILVRLTDIRTRMTIFLTPENLKFLQMSGRVSNTQALIGSVLNVKPIIALDNGALSPAGRIRTRGKAIDHMLALTKQMAGAKRINLAVIHAQADAEAQTVLERARTLMQVAESFVDEMSVVVAAHLGPGCLGLVSYVV